MAWRNPHARFVLPVVLILNVAFLARGESVDSVIAGEEHSEQAHQLRGDQTYTLPFNGRTYRVANTNGWFSWQLKMLPDAPQELEIEFGGERHKSAGVVNIFVNETKIATVRLAGGPRAEYYPLTNAALKGTSVVFVKFQAVSGSRVDGIASVSIVKIPRPTIASMSKASSTRTNWQFIVNAVNDQHEPKSSGDRLKKHFDWWPAKATNQWVQYDFATFTNVSSVEVYWFDDTGIGECRPPNSWRVLFREDGEWKPVRHPSEYGCGLNRYNHTDFDPVQTDGLRLDVQMPEKFSSGLLQWKVE